MYPNKRKSLNIKVTRVPFLYHSMIISALKFLHVPIIIKLIGVFFFNVK